MTTCLLQCFKLLKNGIGKGMKNQDVFTLTSPVNLRSPEDRTIGNIMCGFRIFLTSELIGTKEETLKGG